MGDPGGGGPPSLRAGDRIAVVAPSGPADPASLERGCAVLGSLGLEVVVGKHALDQNPSGLTYLAGSDAERAADLQDAWCDPRVSAVFCARGGYGAARVLDHLDWTALAGVPPKLLHGSSDITALHAAFGRRLSVPTSFGPMVSASLIADADPEALDHLREGLFGPGVPVRGSHALRGGRARGVLTGGNLTLLTSLLGTAYAPEPAAGRIAFLEDVSEAPYRVDRMLTQLLQAGWFEDVAGIVLGTWTGCGELDAVFADRLMPIGVPILAGVPVGHGPRQLTIRLGAGAELDADTLVLGPSTGDGPERRTPYGPVSEETS
jgi:muramoyltetrapeptide carboxypeptidase